MFHLKKNRRPQFHFESLDVQKSGLMLEMKLNNNKTEIFISHFLSLGRNKTNFFKSYSCMWKSYVALLNITYNLRLLNISLALWKTNEVMVKDTCEISQIHFTEIHVTCININYSYPYFLKYHRSIVNHESQRFLKNFLINSICSNDRPNEWLWFINNYNNRFLSSTIAK